MFFTALLGGQLGRQDHLVFVAADHAGTALWRPVDGWKVPASEMVRAAPSVVRAFRARVPAFLRALTAIERVHPDEPHYYLEFLGTRRDRQGSGTGTALLRPMLDRCDHEGLPAYLENSNPANVAFYGRHGFEIRDEVSVGRGAPPVTTMWREPRR